MEINFFTTARMTEFWGYTKMLLQAVSPGVMLVAAVFGVGLLITIVIKAWKTSARDVERDDDDIEYREY